MLIEPDHQWNLMKSSFLQQLRRLLGQELLIELFKLSGWL